MNPPPVSVIVVSRRPDRLRSVLAALAAQTYQAFEVVIGVHGCEPPAEVARFAKVASFPREMPFGEVLGATTAMASGSLLTKVDDDDRYGPGHLWDLVTAGHYSGANVVGMPAEFVHLERSDVAVRRHIASEIYTGAVAGGTLMLSRGISRTSADGGPCADRWTADCLTASCARVAWCTALTDSGSSTRVTPRAIPGTRARIISWSSRLPHTQLQVPCRVRRGRG